MGVQLASSDLIAAYHATHYRVTDTECPFVLRIGVHSAELEALHARHGVACSAFLTAWNPRSRRATLEDNLEAQGRMTAELTHAGYALVAGVGEDPVGAWPGEPSVLMLGVPRAHAEAIGRRYAQNAVVWVGEDAVPELVLLR
jgi:Protein of unknown function (DUF3293)